MSSQFNRRSWSEEEDEVVKRLVAQFGIKNWSLIAYQLTENFNQQPRTGKQCRERWHNHLDPNVDKKPWSQQEEDILYRYHQILGNRWSEISKYLPGRTDNSIKNHFYSNQRKDIRRQNKLKKKVQTKRKIKKSNDQEQEQESILDSQETQAESEQSQLGTKEEKAKKIKIEVKQEKESNSIKEPTKEEFLKIKPNLQLSSEHHFDNMLFQKSNSNISLTPLFSPNNIFQLPITPTSMVYVSPKSATFFTIPESPSEMFKNTSQSKLNTKISGERKTFKF